MSLITQILIGLLVFIIIIAIIILALNYMGNQIDYTCSKVNYQGIIKFWDGDINCSILR